MDAAGNAFLVFYTGWWCMLIHCTTTTVLLYTHHWLFILGNLESQKILLEHIYFMTIHLFFTSL